MEGCDQSKVFVGGISWETTENVLKEHFGIYGEVVGAVIAKDRITGASRGFAFVSFSEPSTLNKVLLDAHTILGRTVEVKRAVPKSEHQQEQSRVSNRTNRTSAISTNNTLKTKKIFVGGLPANVTEDEFKDYFKKFGKIIDLVVMHDSITRRPRGFGFITFDSEDPVEEVMQKNYHELCGKLVEVKRAVPKEENIATGGNGMNSCSPALEILPIYGGYPYYGGAYYGYGLGPISFVAPWGPYPVYPSYINNGYGLMGVVGNGYNGIMGFGPTGKPSQVSADGKHRGAEVYM